MILPLVRHFHFYASSSYLLYYALYLLIIPVLTVIVDNPVHSIPMYNKEFKTYFKNFRCVDSCSVKPGDVRSVIQGRLCPPSPLSLTSEARTYIGRALCSLKVLPYHSRLRQFLLRLFYVTNSFPLTLILTVLRHFTIAVHRVPCCVFCTYQFHTVTLTVNHSNFPLHISSILPYC